MKTKKKVVLLNQVDIDLFESIGLDTVNIKIGNYKLKITNSGIFNQVYNFFVSKKRDEAFILWFYQKYGLQEEEEIPDSVLLNWEDLLLSQSKSLVYIESLRVKYLQNGVIQFYGVKDGCILDFITDTHQPRFYSKIVHYLQFNSACEAICHRLNLEHALAKNDFAISKDIKNCLKDKLIPSVNKIKIISNSDTSYCLGYYDFGWGDASKATPAWDSFIYSVPDDGSRECLKAWIYSVFKDDNFGKQALWLFGRGDTGKSKITEVIAARLKDLNNQLSGSLPSTFFLDKFSSSSFVNKRFIKVPDNVDRALLRLQLVKNITGNDTIAIRNMGQEEKESNVYAKMMITSNVRPFINVEKPEELSRILFIELDSTLGYEASHKWDSAIQGDWGENLYIEFDNFLAKCSTDYFSKLHQDGHNILPYDNMQDNLEQGDYFIKRDMIIWWDNCIKPYTGKNKTNILTVTELVNDYIRFIYPANKSGKFTTVIRRFMMTMIRTKKILVYDLEIGNNIFIEGYQFKNQKITLKDLVIEKTEQVNTMGNQKAEIHGKA